MYICNVANFENVSRTILISWFESSETLGNFDEMNVYRYLIIYSVLYVLYESIALDLNGTLNKFVKINYVSLTKNNILS